MSFYKGYGFQTFQKYMSRAVPVCQAGSLYQRKIAARLLNPSKSTYDYITWWLDNQEGWTIYFHSPRILFHNVF